MEASSRPCALCGGRLTDILDFGEQPLCNRFLTSRDDAEYLHPLALGQCARCALIQILNPVPPTELSSRFEWIAYREPEDHLDALASVIAALPGMRSGPTAAGLSSVDDSLLRRLRERVSAKTWRIDVGDDLDADAYPPAVQLVQQKLSVRFAEALATRYGRPKAVIGRFVLEHAHDVRRFLAGVRSLVADDGYVIFEVPDCEKAQVTRDYSAVWEEHILYFTESMLRETVRRAGFEIKRLERYPYRIQDSLVVIAAPAQSVLAQGLSAPEMALEKSRWNTWVASLDGTRERVRHFINTAAGIRRVAMFGAAQRGCSFVNLLGLGESLAVVLDDDERKHGYFMPGSRAPIAPSRTLNDGTFGLCLLASRPESQDGIRRANPAFLASGGRFASIYPDGPSGLPL